MPLAGGSFQLRFPVASGISANSGNLRCSFVTFTANPSWKEIQDELLKDTKGETMQHWRNHPDLVARVFYLKNKAMLEDFKNGKFGRYRGHVQVIEWQKRGLPHSHTLFWLEGPWDDPAHIDQFVSAEIPSAFNEPTLAPYSLDNDGRPRPCSRGFPKPFNSETTITPGQYAQYRRRDGSKVELVINGEVKSVENEWVVPFSPYLRSTYNTHISVEVCASINSLKYLHKYMHKGSDRATIEFNMGIDEITEYISGRWWVPWKVLGPSLVSPKWATTRRSLLLVVHMPNEQPVT
ncbi:hypothetical protein VTN31DRAFT_2060 [Thermomyces dupontii]|uniref:uncharacterized protein n=1 Tax=Talaromyces thermophilus TaxID=28565 RepID=UPI003742FE51